MSIQDLRTPSFDPERDHNESLDVQHHRLHKKMLYSLPVAGLLAGIGLSYLGHKAHTMKEGDRTRPPLTQQLILEEFDANNDGRLDKNEFERMLREYQIVLRTNSF